MVLCNETTGEEAELEDAFDLRFNDSGWGYLRPLSGGPPVWVKHRMKLMAGRSATGDTFIQERRDGVVVTTWQAEMLNRTEVRYATMDVMLDGAQRQIKLKVSKTQLPRGAQRLYFQPRDIQDRLLVTSMKDVSYSSSEFLLSVRLQSRGICKF